MEDSRACEKKDPVQHVGHPVRAFQGAEVTVEQLRVAADAGVPDATIMGWLDLDLTGEEGPEVGFRARLHVMRVVRRVYSEDPSKGILRVEIQFRLVDRVKVSRNGDALRRVCLRRPQDDRRIPGGYRTRWRR